MKILGVDKSIKMALVGTGNPLTPSIWLQFDMLKQYGVKIS